jgi:acyl transferase domain-containing protein/acyl carrier protein
MPENLEQEPGRGLDIAVIGMAGCFPGAKNIDEFWENLKRGGESVSFFTDEELTDAGVSAGALKSRGYVRANPMLAGCEYFDASFFDYLPGDVEFMDPQVRIFHECVWEALEDAGYDPFSYKGLIGLYAGASMNNSWIAGTFKMKAGESARGFSGSLFFDKDFLTTHISYKLNLRGPSSTIFTACSTSLVAVHQACQGLLSGECEIALAGGVSILLSQGKGYLCQEGLIHSPDGHCRAFDAGAKGTLFGSGAGVVVLKQLEGAIVNRDNVYAVLIGSAVNNDGNQKVGFTAPGVKGQAAVIRAALQAAEVPSDSIGYIETHGTGTAMGDPIEIEALSQAFNTDKKAFCAIGSVKTNIGHLDAAAGISSFIKTVLALKHGCIPPSLHFESPNPEIDFGNTPFYVNTGLADWRRGSYPRRAGVSSFGIGGTNAHVILEEAPSLNGRPEGLAEGRECQLILLSAQTETALRRVSQNLAGHFNKSSGINLRDAAYTLQVGRTPLEYRQFFVCSRLDEAAEVLSTPDSPQWNGHRLLKKDRNRRVVFMFPGQGAQYENMGLALYQGESLFREEMDRCFGILDGLMDFRIKEVLFPSPGTPDRHSIPGINQTEVAQPLLFVFEYALARLLMAWGIKPQAMIGHSIGEYVAACLSGVFSLEDALALVSFRGKLMQQIPPGAMLGVPLSEERVKPLLNESVSLAAVNGPNGCVVSGPPDAVDQFAEELKRQGYEGRPLHTSHAFHSAMMEPVVEEFRERVGQIRLNEPGIPYISNVSGGWISGKEAVDPGYWALHLRETVRFSDGLKELLKGKNVILVEVGPGQVLSMLARKQARQGEDGEVGNETEAAIINLVRHPQEQVSDSRYLLTKIGQLWLYGQTIDWSEFYSAEKRYRLSLPTYPFEGLRYWAAMDMNTTAALPLQREEIDDWFYIPSWKRSLQPAADHGKTAGTCWLVFSDSLGLGSRLVERLEGEGAEVVSVEMGDAFGKVNSHSYTLNPGKGSDYDALFDELAALKRFPGFILHLWNITGSKGEEASAHTLERGFYSLLSITQALGRQGLRDDVRLTVVTDHMQEVVGGELLFPQKAAVLGVIQVMNREYPHIRCRSVDVVLPAPKERQYRRLEDQLLAESLSGNSEPVIAYRHTYRWVRSFESVRLNKPAGRVPRLKERGIYLITGGLGGIGLILAEHLASSVEARLILIGRSSFPHKNEWDRWLKEHGGDDPVAVKINKLRELESLGAEVIVLGADVTNPAQMQEIVARAKAQFGAVNGVIHAAGVADGALIQRRTRPMSEAVLAPKIAGTLTLHRVLQQEALDFFMLCSSILSILPPMGQAAYAAANAFLDAFACCRASKDKTFTVSVNWDIWQEVGMTAKESVPPPPELQSRQLAHPLFDTYMSAGDNLGVLSIHLRVDKHWFLDEHRVMGSAIVLGTVYLELARAAFEVHTGGKTVEIRDVFYLNPLMVAEGEEKELRVVLKKRGDYFEFFCVSPAPAKKDEWIPHARGEIAAGDMAPPKKHSLNKIEARCRQSQMTPGKDNRKLYEGSFIEVGPRWHSLVEVKLGERRGLALFQLPAEYADDMKVYQLHPALLDYATSFLPMTDRRIPHIKGGYLPFSYKCLRLRGPLPARFFVYSRFVENRGGGKETLSFDVTIMDEEGSQRVDIEGFTLLTVMDEGKSAAQEVRRRFPLPAYIASPAKKRAGSSEGHLERASKTGIRPAEGVGAFDRIMAGTMPQVLVSTRHLEKMAERPHAAGISSTSRDTPPEKFVGTSRMRPELSSLYVAPRDKIEQVLAQTLGNYLGIDKVGINDNFFDLGASSLDLVQLSRKFSEAVGQEIAVVNLFRYPMIGLLAESLNRQGRPADTPGEAGEKKRFAEVLKGRQGMQERLRLIKEEKK